MEIKNFNQFNEEYIVDNNHTIPFDEDIRKELKQLFKGSVYDKTGTIDTRIEQLFGIHKKWLYNAKKLYNANDIAKKLYHYDSHLK